MKFFLAFLFSFFYGKIFASELNSWLQKLSQEPTLEEYESFAQMMLSKASGLSDPPEIFIYVPLGISQKSLQSGFDGKQEFFNQICYGLFRYLEKLSLRTMVKARLGQLSKEEKESFIYQIHCGSDQRSIIENNEVDPTPFPERTVSLILDAIKETKLEPAESTELALDYLNHCASEMTADKAFKLIIAGFEALRHVKSHICTFKCFSFSSQFVSFEKFDQFLTEFYEKFPSRVNDLFKFLYYGPKTAKSDELLKTLLESESSSFEIMKMIDNEWEISFKMNTLIRKILDATDVGHLFDHFPESFFAIRPNMSEFKFQLLDQAVNRRVALKLADISEVELADILSNKFNVLDELYGVYPELVIETAEKIINRIFDLITVQSETHPAANGLKVEEAFSLMLLLPTMQFRQKFQIKDVNFEPVADFFIQSKVCSEFHPRLFLEMLLKTYFIITPSFVRKILTLFHLHKWNSSELHQDICFTLISSCKFRLGNKEEDILPIFEVFYEEFSSKGVDMSIASEILLLNIFDVKDRKIYDNFIQFCREKKLISKTFIIIMDSFSK